MGAPDTNLATVSFYIDDDFNPLNGNASLLKQMIVPGNGAGSVSSAIVNVTLDSTNAAPGYHTLYATISGGGQTRYLYAPEVIEVLADAQIPVLDITLLSARNFYIGVSAGSSRTIVLQTSYDLRNWVPLATNQTMAARWVYTNTMADPAPGRQYFRAAALLRRSATGHVTEFVCNGRNHAKRIHFLEHPVMGLLQPHVPVSPSGAFIVPFHVKPQPAYVRSRPGEPFDVPEEGAENPAPAKLGGDEARSESTRNCRSANRSIHRSGTIAP